MSDSFTFGLATGMPVEELLATVECLWPGDDVSVETVDHDRETVRFHLSWYFGTEEEKRVGRRIASYLIDCSTGQEISYYLTSEGADNLEGEPPTATLGIDEIFSDSYEPDIGEGYRRYYSVVHAETGQPKPRVPPRVRFLINPTAGGGRGAGLLGPAELAKADGGFDVSRSAGHLRELARQAIADGVKRVVAVGGDGTVHHAIQELAGSQTELAVVPCGRGDDFAISLGIPREVDQAVELAVSGQARPVDLLSISGPRVGEGEAAVWGGLYASFGFDSRVTHVANEQSRWVPRSLTYILATLRALVGFEAPVIRLEHDGGVHEERSMFVTICNAPIYGGGMRVAPNASMTDGLLDVVAVRRVSKLTLLRVFPRVFEGRHVDHPALTLLRTRRARITVDDEVLVGSDGEIEGRAGAEPTEVTVEPAALRVVAPDPA